MEIESVVFDFRCDGNCVGVSVFVCCGCDEVSCVVAAALEEFFGVDFLAVDCRCTVPLFGVTNFIHRDVVFLVPFLGASDPCWRSVLGSALHEARFSWDDFFDGCVFWVEVGCVAIHEDCCCCKKCGNDEACDNSFGAFDFAECMEDCDDGSCDANPE